MYKELQMMIHNWKQKAENLHAKSEDKKSSPKYQLKYFKTAEIQLLQCIGEAELLLKQMKHKEQLAQLNKHDVSGRSELCDHEFISREYTSQPYGTCLSCGKTILS